MKKIHVSAINRKVRDDEKLFVEECDRKYNEKLVAIADSIEISDKAAVSYTHLTLPTN